MELWAKLQKLGVPPRPEWVSLSLYPGEEAPLTLAADDFVNAGESNSSYSKSFEIPADKINSKFFYHTNEMGMDGNRFDLLKRTDCRITVDGIVVFEGILQMNEMSLKDNIESFEITCFSETISFKDTLESVTLGDLDVDELAHQATRENIAKSWNSGIGLEVDAVLSTTSPAYEAALGTTNTNAIKYPTIKYNNNSYYTANNLASASTGSIGENSDLHRPWIRVSYLWDKIFADNGYTYSVPSASTFLYSSAFTKLYYDITPGEEGVSSLNQVKVHGANQTAGGTFSPGVWAPVTFTTGTIVVGVTPVASYWDFTTNQTQLLAAGAIMMDVSLQFTGNIVGLVTIRIKNMTTGGIVAATSGICDLADNGGQGTILTLTSGLVNANSDVYEVQVNPVFGQAVRNSTAATFVTITALDANISPAQHLKGPKGEISQWDFLKQFMTMFNLIITAGDGPNHFYIWQYQDWMQDGNSVNWTHKIDETEIIQKPIEEIPLKYKFAYTADEDDAIEISQMYPNDWKYTRYKNTGSHFYNEELTEIVLENLAATDVITLGGANLIIPNMVNKEGDEFWENIPRVLYDNNIKTLTADTVTLYSNVSGDVNSSTYGCFSMCKTQPASNTTSHLSWKPTNYDHTGGTMINDLYTTYYSSYIAELTKHSGRVVEFSLRLTPTDINMLEFNDKIIIKNQHYRIQEIDYSASGLSKLIAIRINDL